MADDENTGLSLPRGATGFRSPTDGPLPETDLRAFKSALHAAARAAGGTVGEVEEQAYPCTFHTASVVEGAGEHIILCHAHHPWIAFARMRRNWYSEEFAAPPSWAGVLAHAGFLVLAREQLTTPLADVETSGLSRAEWRAIRLYGTTTWGGAVFNAWD
ncbi:hypothetical protein [Streptomyces sp. NPDC020597]|uniref:hypothetical protein n=1 Tax=unclassified Streptomyces TaxID=2593676 RepID=UPI0037A78055